MKIIDLFKKSGESGVRLPFVFDATTGKPSITVFFPYATFIVALLGSIVLFFNQKFFVAEMTAIGFWALSTVLYMIRRITRAKFDLKDKSVELSSEDEAKPEIEKEAK